MKDAFRRGLADFLNYKYLHGICVVTIALSVFVISAFGLFLMNASDMMESWKRGIRIIAYLEQDTDPTVREDVIAEIRRYEGVAEIEYVAGDEAFEWLRSEIGRQTALLEGLSGNPLPDSIEVSLSADIGGSDAISGLAERIGALSHVTEVEYARQWLERFSGIYNLFRLTSMVLIGLIGAAVMLIVANTIRLILYSRIEEIRITRIIGADDTFIKYPLYMEGVMLGLAGGAAGLILLYGAYAATVPQLESAGLLVYFQVRFLPWSTALTILSASMIIGWLGCYFSIRRFLRF